MRTRPGVMPIAACSSGVRATWVLDAEWHTSVSGPPSEVAQRASRKLSSMARAASTPPARSIASTVGRHVSWRRRQVVLRVVGQARMVDGGDSGMVDQRLGDPQCHVGLVPLAHGQRADAAQPVQGVVGRRAGAVQHPVGPDGVEQVPLTGEDAERGVVVAGDALRRRVHDEVDAVADRLLADRCGERRVEHRERPGDGAEVVQVDEIEARVRGALGDHEHRAAGAHRGGEGPRLRAVDDGVVDAEPGARPLDEGHRAGVDLALDHDVVAGRAQRQDGAGDGAHPRAEGQGVLGALEFGHGVLEGAHGGVGVAAVEVAGAHAGGPLAGVVQAVGLPGAGAPQRNVEAVALVAPARRDGARRRCRRVGAGVLGHEGERVVARRA